MTDFISDSIDGRGGAGSLARYLMIREWMLIFVWVMALQTPGTNVKGSGQECPIYTTNPDAKSWWRCDNKDSHS